MLVFVWTKAFLAILLCIELYCFCQFRTIRHLFNLKIKLSLIYVATPLCVGLSNEDRPCSNLYIFLPTITGLATPSCAVLFCFCLYLVIGLMFIFKKLIFNVTTPLCVALSHGYKLSLFTLYYPNNFAFALAFTFVITFFLFIDNSLKILFSDPMNKWNFIFFLLHNFVTNKLNVEWPINNG